MNSARTYWFSDTTPQHVKNLGIKGTNLGLMYSKGFPIPNGFIISSEHYKQFIKNTSLHQKILHELAGLDLENSKKIIDASNNIKTAILTADLPDSLVKEVKTYYKELCGEFNHFVAVRPSVTFESADANLFEHNESLLNVKGVDDLLKAIKHLWASLFESKILFYRIDKGFNHFNSSISVIVQLMIQTEVSGIVFTHNPLDESDKTTLVEAAFGLGKPLISGEVSSDNYVIDKDSHEIQSISIGRQTWQLTLDGQVPISKAYMETQKLSASQIAELLKLSLKVEKYFEYSCDISWGICGKKLYIFQVTPHSKSFYPALENIDVSLHATETCLLEGLGATSGVYTGSICVIKNYKDLSKVTEGCIAVMKDAHPSYIHALKDVSGIITDEGDRLSDAASIARELGIPCIVGTLYATRMLKNGEMVSMDGAIGKVFEHKEPANETSAITSQSKSISPSNLLLKTATKIYLDVADYDLVKDRLSDQLFDGVGILRSEYVINNYNLHPYVVLKDKKEDHFISYLSWFLSNFTKKFHPYSVIYKLSDLYSYEYKKLKGGKDLEDSEANPLLGLHGTTRHLKRVDLLELELEALKNVRNKQGFKNLYLMLSFVRTLEDFREIKKHIASFGLRRGGNFKLWLSLDLPSNALLIDSYIEEGIDGVNINLDMLNSLMLGIDPYNMSLAYSYAELDNSVIELIQKVITSCKKKKVLVTISGKNINNSSKLIEQLIECGITGFTLDIEHAATTQAVIASVEKNLLNKNSKKKTRVKSLK